MAVTTITYPGASVTVAHGGGPIAISSNQRGVHVQVERGGVVTPLEDQNGRYPLNKGTFELQACNLIVSAGAHAFGKDQADILVDIT